MPASFPDPEPDVLHLTEGGVETEVMFKHGHDLPEFAMYPLLDNRRAVDDMRTMFREYLDTAAAHGFAALMSGLDYRASPDWGEKLGYSREGLAEINLRAIEFLREIAAPYRDQIPAIRFGGVIGPRGDAYSRNQRITAAEAEDYHSTQLETLRRAGVDLAVAMTFNNIPEAIGLARAASALGVPLCLYFSLDSRSRLNTGPSLREAIETTDRETGRDAPAFYGINCSHPVEFLPAIEPGDWVGRIRALRPNAAKMDKIALCKLGHLEEGDPVELGAMMGNLARDHPGIDIWGGCCGCCRTHLDEIARNVAQARRASTQ